ncbi:nucleoside recognition domain-containing protein [Acidaminobacter sp.]|uniref:nucleoside recognition domain-containing protein n=1 Tax=Acidaminobacter sp. TaxID=1872102 RepID=UPI0025628D8A|nr:nucleoside recognition domain-containing protein [Acidaminobacter sp.]MDK9711478.1 nucleoside recognition protein [Acidaminobacter sp.]
MGIEFNVIEVLKEAVFGSLKSVWSIAIIVFPLMIVMEFARKYKVMDVISAGLRPLTRFLGVQRSAAFPLAVGLIFGLAYGSGVIIQSAQEGEIDLRSLTLVSIFLACCHAVVEDTLLFVAVGANGWLLLGLRTLAAFIVTMLVSKSVKLAYEAQ